jgi:uncharacterized phage protein (TIGR01671 family)
MNREILFKAKPKNWRQQESENYWVEGYYAQLGTGDRIEHYIVQNMALCKLFENEELNMCFTDVEIDPTTLCQFTGMTDIGDYKIFEGDIMRTSVTGLTQHIGTVEFADGSFCLRCTDGNAFFLCFVAGSYAVIGNVFDNPELLTGHHIIESKQYET